MRKKPHSRTVANTASLNITRRDFVGGTLAGSGAALLTAAAPLAGCSGPAGPSASKGVFSDPWTGYGGVGDYARSNGNVAGVREAAHLIRDGFASELTEQAIDTGEVYDMVIVGGGFSGAGAAYRFKEEFGDGKTCLTLENHPIFGGEAKQNEFEVDGYRLYGPQGSNGFLPPPKDTVRTLSDRVWRRVNTPMDYDFYEPPAGTTNVRAPLDSYDSMYWGERKFDVGYYFGGSEGWVVNPWADGLARTPWGPEFRTDLARAYNEHKKYYEGEDFDRWLDSMSYADYLETEMGLASGVTRFFDPLVAIGDFGLSADVISAYAAHLLFLPGTTAYGQADSFNFMEIPTFYSFPGGNAGYYRHIMKYLKRDAIKGGDTFEEILNNPVNFDALDRAGDAFRFRLNATVIDVSHEGDPDTAELVNVTYKQGDRLLRVKARSVIMAIGGWVARNVVSDMPEHIHEAYSQFHHGPVLVVNVALRNWRFLDKMGISSARWFEGFGTFCSIRRPMVVGDATQPFDPDKPTVLTFYVPFNYPGEEIGVQGSLGRNELLSKTYAQYEAEILSQMTDMFGPAGFDAKRDVAGIVLNRWGHAYIAPQPGFFFGKDGKPAPKEVVKQGFGRVHFGHSELSSRMNYRNAIAEGGRAADSAMKVLI